MKKLELSNYILNNMYIDSVYGLLHSSLNKDLFNHVEFNTRFTNYTLQVILLSDQIKNNLIKKK